MMNDSTRVSGMVGAIDALREEVIRLEAAGLVVSTPIPTVTRSGRVGWSMHVRPADSGVEVAEAVDLAVLCGYEPYLKFVLKGNMVETLALHGCRRDDRTVLVSRPATAAELSEAEKTAAEEQAS